MQRWHHNTSPCHVPPCIGDIIIPLHAPYTLLGDLPAGHALEHCCAAALRWEMQLVADVGQIANGVQDVVVEVFRMRRRETHADATAYRSHLQKK